MRTNAMTSIISILISSAFLGCSNDAAAFSAARPTAALAADVPVLTDPGVSPGVDTFDDGFSLGLRNGGLIVERVRQKTMSAGCEGIADLQRALRNVVASVSPPAGHSGAFVAGLFRGYVKTVSDAIEDSRRGCELTVFSSDQAAFAGEFAAAVVCGLVAADAAAIGSFPFAPIYDGWAVDPASGSACSEAFIAATATCLENNKVVGGGVLASAQAQSCAL